MPRGRGGLSSSCSFSHREASLQICRFRFFSYFHFHRSLVMRPNRYAQPRNGPSLVYPSVSFAAVLTRPRHYALPICPSGIFARRLVSAAPTSRCFSQVPRVNVMFHLASLRSYFTVQSLKRVAEVAENSDAVVKR